MITQTSSRLPPAPPPAVMAEIRRRLSGRELQALETVFALRIAAQQVENTVTEWMAGSVGSTARWQVLTLLWAAHGRGVPHKDIVAAMGVTRATVSGLMAGLEREGFVSSRADRDDRRKLLATLTPKGGAVMGKAIEANKSRLRAVFTSFSSAELTTLAELLRRVREGFAARAPAPAAAHSR
jgi:DNA-binding MarR family transcriptional regulator